MPAPSPYGRIKAQPPYAAPGQVIGLLGGSFNPPHAAHRLISETALKRLGLDKVWWIVSPGNPLKNRAEQAPLAERMVLCRQIAKNPRIEITDFEADLPTPYTASTIAFLKRRSPLVRFVWIMGADNLASFHRWRMKALASKAAQAFADHRVPEADARALLHSPAPAWTFLTGPLSHLSSTALRGKAKARASTVAKKSHAPAELPWRKEKPAENAADQATPVVTNTEGVPVTPRTGA
jgi:nicotinate-nucleotide adenylyltransferase